MSNQHNKFDYPENQTSSPMPWIVAAVLGAMLMLVTGMFVMYIMMSGFKKAPAKLADVDAPAAVAQTPSTVTVAAEEVETPEKPIKLEASKSTRDQKETLPSLPDTTEIQKNMTAGRNSTIAYDFTNESMVYGFTIALKPKGEREVNFSGRTTYKPSDADPEDLVEGIQSGESTGTGFVVHPQGIVVTCAHVVDRANSVEVTIGDEIHQATVVCTDDENDLALLRIDSKDLPYLSIADQTDVEQGESIRVFGFPLTTQLGGSMKISSGTVTGFSDDTREAQLDATVNPGNSGGPVVDENGTVVGVASALLAAEGISSVGLAVNVEKLRKFIKSNKIPFSDLSNKKSKQQIKDAVVFIRNHGGSADVESSKSVEFQSYFSGGGIRKNDKGKIVFDERGTLANPNENQKSLPLIFQRLCQVGIEELPRTLSRPWTVSNPITIERTKTEQREQQRNPFGLPGFGPRHFRGFHDPFRGLHDPFGRGIGGGRNEVVKEKTVTIIAKETKKIVLDSNDDQFAIFKKYFKIATVQSPDKEFNIDLKYDGKFKFDKKQQRLSEGKFNGDVILAIEGEPTRLPFSFHYQLIGKEKLDKEQANRQASVDAQKEREEKILEITTDKFDQYDPEK